MNLTQVARYLMWAALTGVALWYAIGQSRRNRRGEPDDVGSVFNVAALRKFAGVAVHRLRQAKLPLAVATVFAVIVGMSAPTAAAATNDNSGNAGNAGNGPSASGGNPTPPPKGGPSRQPIKWTLPPNGRDRAPGQSMSSPRDTENSDTYDGKANMPGQAGNSLSKVVDNRGEGIGDALGTAEKDITSPKAPEVPSTGPVSGSSATTSTPTEMPELPSTGQVSGSSAVVGAIGASIVAQKMLELGNTAYQKLLGTEPKPSALDVSKANEAATNSLTKSLALSDEELGRTVDQMKQQAQLKAQAQLQQQYGRTPKSAQQQLPSQQQQAKSASESESSQPQENAQNEAEQAPQSSATAASQAQEEEAAQAQEASEEQETANLNAQAAAQKTEEAQVQQQAKANQAASQQQAAASEEQEQQEQAKETATENQAEASSQEAETEAANGAAAEQTAAASAARLQQEQNAEAAQLSRPSGVSDGSEDADAVGEESTGETSSDETDSGDSDTSDAPEEEAPAPAPAPELEEDGVPPAGTMNLDEMMGFVSGGEA